MIVNQAYRYELDPTKTQRGALARHAGTARFAYNWGLRERLHRRIKYRRLDFLHKLTTRLARTKSAIVVEDLAVGNMTKNRSLSRSISDVGWSEFRRQLTYKTQWYGSRLVVADRFFPSSKTCSSCSAVKVELALSEREFVCEACGVVLDRDLNAAKNLARLAERATESSSGSNACGETTVGHAGGPSRDEPKARRRPRRDRTILARASLTG